MVDEKLLDDARTMDSVRTFDTDDRVDLTMTAFAREMVDSSQEIDQDIREKHWGFFGKDTILSKFGGDDQYQTTNDIAIARNWRIMSLPAYAININDQVQNEQIRRRMICQAKRGDQGFERTSLTTSVKVLQTTPQPRQGGGGILSAIKSKFGLGPKPEGGVINA